eukprot:GFKZ01013275.1.p1 GENE.GFKZ01013275.1~~GFKZ01013275.1.p1  ORF type:complete len:437 (-),score=32.37 GFKZ01013275.1:282-1592(-)
MPLRRPRPAFILHPLPAVKRPSTSPSPPTCSNSATPPPQRRRLHLPAILAALLAISPPQFSVAHALPRPRSASITSTISSPRPSPARHVRVKGRSAEQAPSTHGLQGQSFLVAGSAAFLASATAVAVTHPIDTLKTLRQAPPNESSTSRRRRGIAALYRGVFSNILKEAPNAAIYLATYELFKTALLALPGMSALPLLAMCLAGMLGDALGSIVRVPAEIVNKRLQCGLNDSWEGAARDAFMNEGGLEGTLASWEAVLWRDVPYGGLQIAGYEAVRGALAGFGLGGLPGSIIAGAVAGVVAAVVTTPADVLVTRMSTQRPQCYLETGRYMRPGATLRRIVKEEGFGGLWKGAAERGLFYMPMIALFFAGYEGFKSVIMRAASAVGGLGLSKVGSFALGAIALPGLTGRLFAVAVWVILGMGNRRAGRRSAGITANS